MVNLRFRLAYITLGFAVLFSAYVYFGSLDSEEPHFQNFLGDLPPANPDLNGYRYLDSQGLVDSEFLDKDTVKWLKQDLKFGGWEPDVAEKLVNQYREELSAFKVAAAMPILQYEATDDPTELPLFVDLMNGIRLILLEAKLSAEQGDLDQSVVNLELAWQFSEKVKRMNGFLISYMIGIASQDEVLKSLQWIITRSDVDEEYLSQLIKTLERATPFNEDEFKPVMQAELRYFVGYFDNFIDQPLAKRWSAQFEQASWVSGEESWYAGRKRQLWAALQALFPKFYIHRNKNLNLMSIELEAVVGWAGFYCNELDALAGKEYEWFPEVTWKEITLPNQALLSLYNHRGQFKEYLNRRCMAYTQIEAARALLGSKLYAKKHDGEYPISLKAMVPSILSGLPVDYMDGQQLRYSPEHRWFYSLGANLRDDSGSSSTCYFNRCFFGSACKDNPTFPFDLNVCEP